MRRVSPRGSAGITPLRYIVRGAGNVLGNVHNSPSGLLGEITLPSAAPDSGRSGDA